VSVAGQQGGEDSGYANGNGSTYFSVDGSNATNNYFSDIVGRNRIPYLFGEDSIQEFQVAVSPYTAIYGGGAGFVNAVTRSGGNAFHGSAFYYNRNSVFEANDALDKAAGNPQSRKMICSNSALLSAAPSCATVYGSSPITSSNCTTIRLPSSTRLWRRTPANLASVAANLFNIPAGTPLPAAQRSFAHPECRHRRRRRGRTLRSNVSDLYLQQVSNTLNALSSNLGIKARNGNDWVITPRLDYQATNRDSLFLSLNFNRFNSPGGVILDPTVGNYGTQTLANAYVRTFQATLGWTHTFSPTLLNEFHAGTSQG
jgi:hypothetical protein